MKVSVWSGWGAYEFACNARSCAPPPVGSGGSLKSAGAGKRLAPCHGPSCFCKDCDHKHLVEQNARDAKATEGPITYLKRFKPPREFGANLVGR